MCGIAGTLGFDADLLTRRMTGALVHRGPDDAGFYSGDGAALGFRRLSIIDLEGGMQPLRNDAGDIFLVLKRSLDHGRHGGRAHCDSGPARKLAGRDGRDAEGRGGLTCSSSPMSRPATGARGCCTA